MPKARLARQKSNGRAGIQHRSGAVVQHYFVDQRVSSIGSYKVLFATRDHEVARVHCARDLH
jgi:hypothetical protein